jgi:hypothetical protein
MLVNVGNILCGNNEDLPEYFIPSVVADMKFWAEPFSAKMNLSLFGQFTFRPFWNVRFRPVHYFGHQLKIFYMVFSVILYQLFFV